MATLKTSEKWVPLKGYETKYAISSHGRVYSFLRWRYMSPMRTGTRRLSGQKSKIRVSSSPRKDISVDCCVLESFVCARPKGYVVMHLDDNTYNNRLDNLKWGTPKENSIDCAKKSRGGNQKLSPSQVNTIKNRREVGESGSVLAKEFRISPQRVCDIYKGRTSL